MRNTSEVTTGAGNERVRRRRLFNLAAALSLVLCAATYVAIFLGYGTQLIAMMFFFILASLWFHFWRYRFVRRGDQFTMPWPRPQGY